MDPIGYWGEERVYIENGPCLGDSMTEVKTDSPQHIAMADDKGTTFTQNKT